jgi:hypothetical protein
MLPSTHPHQFVPFGQEFAVYRSLDGAGGLTTYWYCASNGASTEGLPVDIVPIITVQFPDSWQTVSDLAAVIVSLFPAS